MRDEIVLHLGCIGVPITWSLIAVYGGSLGVAFNAAESWYERSASREGDAPSDCPQFIIQIKDGKVARTRLWMGEHHLRHQSHDEGTWLVQWHTFPIEIAEETRALVVETLRAELKAFGFLIPRTDWERLYPGKVLTVRRFADFTAAAKAHDASGVEGDMPYEPRWAMFMPAPKGYKPAFDVEVADHDVAMVRERTPNGRRRLDGNWDIKTAEARCRLLNSGWTAEEVEILMRDEPVEA